MKRFIITSIFTALSTIGASAQSPVGEWLVEDGNAHIRIVPCGSALWGVISWTKSAPGKDENNPDPSKRNRSVLGIPILLNMKKASDRWDGEVYNAENGQTYNAHISLVANDVLKIEGCVLGGLFCGGENWKRLPVAAADKKTEPPQDVCARLAKKS